MHEKETEEGTWKCSLTPIIEVSYEQWLISTDMNTKIYVQNFQIFWTRNFIYGN